MMSHSGPSLLGRTSGSSTGSSFAFRAMLNLFVALWIIAFVIVIMADFHVPPGMKLWEFIVYDRVGVIHELVYMWAGAFGSIYSIIWLHKWSKEPLR